MLVPSMIADRDALSTSGLMRNSLTTTLVLRTVGELSIWRLALRSPVGVEAE